MSPETGLRMSLRKKIILLFGFFAVLPMLALAAFSYWHAQNLLRTSVQGQLEELAHVVVGDLQKAEDGIQRSLERAVMGGHPVDGFDPAVGLFANGSPLSLSDLDQDPVMAKAAYVQLRDALGPIRTVLGQDPGIRSRCGAEGSSRMVEYSAPFLQGGVELALTAGFWASDLVAWQRLSPGQGMILLDPNTGQVVFSDECSEAQDLNGMIPPLLLLAGDEREHGPRRFSFKSLGERRLAASWPAEEAGLTVLATAVPPSMMGSLNRLVVYYWLFVLGLGLTTALSFSVLLGRFTKSLHELARAAEEIGTGELDPWLPLPTSGEVGQLTLTFSRMLARIRQMMTQVDQNGRLAVVGQLSAYLAHEIRNPLSSIKLNLQRLKRWTDRGSIPSFCLEPLEISLREVERLSASVSGVLQLSRAQDSPREVVGLHDLVAEANELLATKFRRQGVELKVDLDAQADRVLARAGQLKSVILNLMVNALEAQPNGGELEIRSELARAPEIGGPVLALHFKDTGCGIDPGIRDRVFEPFFTTKAGGSGIGLAMAFQSVRENDGDLYLEPSLSSGSGAEFVMAFPLAAAERGADLTPVPSRPLLNMGNGSPRWAMPERPSRRSPEPTTEDGPSQDSGVPAHLMTPAGLKAVLALSTPDSEEVN